MSYLTKEQLETYLNGLPSNKDKTKHEIPRKKEYTQLKNELVYPMKQLSLEEDPTDSIQDRKNRLTSATGYTTHSSHSSLPETPKPSSPVQFPNKSSNNNKYKIDPFEASLDRPSVHTPVHTHERPAIVREKPATTREKPAIVREKPAIVREKPVNTSEKQKVLSPIYAGIDCPGCHQPVSGTVVSALNHIWHAGCFQCTSCHKSLENEKFHEKENRPYCTKDYDRLFGLYCDYCNKPIENHAIVALGKNYHENHFVCTACKTPFTDKSAFMVHDEKPYCKEDYLKLYGNKCAGCNEYISGEYINALDQSWHRSCFHCTTCKKPFTHGQYMVKNNKPYCEEDYRHASRPAVKPKPTFVSSYQEDTNRKHNSFRDTEIPPKPTSPAPPKSSYQYSRPSPASTLGEHPRPPLPSSLKESLQSRMNSNASSSPSEDHPRTEMSSSFRNSPQHTSIHSTSPFSPLAGSPRPTLPPSLKDSPTKESSDNRPFKSQTPRQLSEHRKETNTKICHHCKEPLKDSFATALGHDYHIQHFQCYHCGRALSSRVPGMWQGDDNNELICKMCLIKH